MVAKRIKSDSSNRLEELLSTWRSKRLRGFWEEVSLPLSQLHSPGSLRTTTSKKRRQISPAIYRRLRNCGADVIKIATQACSFEDNIRLFEQAEEARETESQSSLPPWVNWEHSHALSATGRGSLWTYASLQKGRESAPGQFTASELINLYSVDDIDEATQFYGVIGWPVGHSLSPHIHNPALRQLGLNARYLPFPIKDLKDFGPHLRRFAGFSVTIPHKVKILDFVDVVDETVKQTGAANTLVNRAGKLFAFNTDVCGTQQALKKAFEDGVHRDLAGNGRRRSGRGTCAQRDELHGNGSCQRR